MYLFSVLFACRRLLVRYVETEAETNNSLDVALPPLQFHSHDNELEKGSVFNKQWANVLR